MGWAFNPFTGKIDATNESYIHPTRGFRLIENFVATTAVGNLGWTVTLNSGSVGTNASTGSGARMGIARCDTSTSSGSAPSLSLGNGTSLIGGGASFVWEANCDISNLSAIGEEFIIRMGLHSASNGSVPSNGVFLEYDRLNSVNWRIRCRAGGVDTTTTTSSAVPSGVWFKSKITVNAAANLAEFFINDTSIGTITTNIPTGTSQTFSPAFQVIKSSGTTARVLYIDWCLLEVRY